MFRLSWVTGAPARNDCDDGDGTNASPIPVRLKVRNAAGKVDAARRSQVHRDAVELM
jgi:hypothetical protein